MWGTELTERHGMAEILNFPARPKGAPPANEAALPRASAAILFFTGVRYERMAEPAPAGTTPGPKKPRGRRRA